MAPVMRKVLSIIRFDSILYPEFPLFVKSIFVPIFVRRLKAKTEVQEFEQVKEG